MSNYSKIVLKNSDVTSALPQTDFLDYGEIALNYRDKKLYFKNADGSITLFETPNISINGDSNTIVRRDSTGKGLFVGLSTTINSAQPSILAINTETGSGALIQSNTGTYHAEFGNIASDNAAAIDRVRGSYTFFYSGFKGKIKSSNITADRNWTLPNASGTVALTTDITVSLTGSEVLTNKTLTNPTVNNYTEGVVAIGNSGTTKTIDLTSGTFQTVTLTGSCTFTMPTATAGKSFILKVLTGAGGYTATFTGVKFPDNTAPVVTATAGRYDIFSFIADGTAWSGSAIQNFTP
jgi:hypothetical protein